ncbi:MAG: dephospho-CoA kinase [Betaproteobacteria bacterium]|jgi:dephospho-CoA kinase|nr:MAG: dephospho-CoA kinase [Betaproteobacteria bacterium]
MPFTVVLTGGIGSGKTTISDLFAELGVDVIDTDEIARTLTTKAQPAVRQIEERFGPDVIASDGSVDRERMRELVFSDPDARNRLQSILHPLIRAEVQRRLAASGKLYALVVVPLLVESRGYDLADRVLVVDCTEEQQIERVMHRSKLSRDQVEAIMATQASRSQRLAAADDVIKNDGEIEALQSQVEELHRHYLTLSESA